MSTAAPRYVKRMRDRLNHRQSPQPLHREEVGRKNYDRAEEVSVASTASTAAVYDDDDYRQYTLTNKVKEEVKWFFLDVVDAFERKEVIVDEAAALAESKPQSLSVAQLRRDIKRCLDASRPLLESTAALRDLLLWKSPVYTLLLVLVYMYSIYVGYFWALAFQLMILQLSLNYLYTQKNIDIGLVFLPKKEVQMPKIDMSAGQLILDVARIAQSILAFTADFLEKLESLWMWRNPDVTRHFFYLCVYWLAWSMFFSIGTCFGACAMTFGIRLFITTYLFDKFPRLRYRLDTFGYFYRNLPIKTGEIPVRSTSTDSRSFPSSLSLANGIHNTASVYSLSNDSTEGDEEDGIQDVIEYRHCQMYDREKRFPKGSSGMLHFTQGSLIFRANSDMKETVLHFDDMICIKKAQTSRSYAFITGTRKALEVTMEGDDKPIQFLGISKREELFESIRVTLRILGKVDDTVNECDDEIIIRRPRSANRRLSHRLAEE